MDNFLQRMKKLGALEADPHIRGEYRFPIVSTPSTSGWNRSGLDGGRYVSSAGRGSSPEAPPRDRDRSLTRFPAQRAPN